MSLMAPRLGRTQAPRFLAGRLAGNIGRKFLLKRILFSLLGERNNQKIIAGDGDYASLRLAVWTGRKEDFCP